MRKSGDMNIKIEIVLDILLGLLKNVIVNQLMRKNLYYFAKLIKMGKD